MTFGNPVTVNMSKISGNLVNAHWFDPREGTWMFVGEYSNTGKQEFAPPSSGRIWDWVLVLDDVAKNYPTGSSLKKQGGTGK